MRAIEDARQEVQRHIDDSRAQDERDRLGQFGTETTLAREMLTYANGLVPFDGTVRFLDPAFGTGAFYSALLDAFPRSRIEHARGYEIDPSYGGAAKELWDDTSLDLRIEDFTRATPPHSETSRYNLVICNPPYVRHHHIESQDKVRLQHLANYSAAVQLSGLSGLYCYFLCISHICMSQGGFAGWLIPSESMSVSYGTEVKRYLLDQVTLLRIHRFDPQDVQFKD